MNLQEEQHKLISAIYKEVGVAKEKNENNIKNVEFEIAVAARNGHNHQISFEEHHLEGYLKNKKLIDRLYQLLLNFESQGKITKPEILGGD